MKEHSHELTSRFVFDLMKRLDPKLEILIYETAVAHRSADIDLDKDIEFINVESGRDDPHEESAWDNDDEPHTTELGEPLTTYNHFIDIKKGPGVFDDYDGYSYHHGSASKDERELAKDATGSSWQSFLAAILVGDRKVDEALNYWFNDEYVHAPGGQWYAGCSPSLKRYSFYKDKGKYQSVEKEAAARFPLAQSTGAPNHGVPYSVFMPVDNLARYWWNEFQATKQTSCLGPVFHALHDASIPHHAAGICGNWHGRYETELDDSLAKTLSDPNFRAEVLKYFEEWIQKDPAPPSSLGINDHSRRPAPNWSIEMLVTWMALNSYDIYVERYNHFKGGYSFDRASARDLTAKAAALCLLVLSNAANYQHSAAENEAEGSWLELDKPFVDYSFVVPGMTENAKITLQCRGENPITIASLHLSGDGGFRLKKAPNTPAVLQKGEKLSLIVSYTAPKKFAQIAAKRGAWLGHVERKISKEQGLKSPRSAILASRSIPASMNPIFDRQKAVITITSSAENGPQTKIHLSAGGIPIPSRINAKLNQLERLGRSSRPEKRVRVHELKKEVEGLQALWK